MFNRQENVNHHQKHKPFGRWQNKSLKTLNVQATKKKIVKMFNRPQNTNSDQIV